MKIIVTNAIFFSSMDLFLRFSPVAAMVTTYLMNNVLAVAN